MTTLEGKKKGVHLYRGAGPQRYQMQASIVWHESAVVEEIESHGPISHRRLFFFFFCVSVCVGGLHAPVGRNSGRIIPAVPPFLAPIPISPSSGLPKSDVLNSSPSIPAAS